MWWKHIFNENDDELIITQRDIYIVICKTFHSESSILYETKSAVEFLLLHLVCKSLETQRELNNLNVCS